MSYFDDDDDYAKSGSDSDSPSGSGSGSDSNPDGESDDDHTLVAEADAEEDDDEVVDEDDVDENAVMDLEDEEDEDDSINDEDLLKDMLNDKDDDEDEDEDDHDDKKNKDDPDDIMFSSLGGKRKRNLQGQCQGQQEMQYGGRDLGTEDMLDIQMDDELDEDDEDEDGSLYLQKFNQEMNAHYMAHLHPECVSHNYVEIHAMTQIVRNVDGIIVDDLHKTIPFLTKYEKARILGQRAKQLNAGAKAYVKHGEDVIDGYLIAEMELKEKKIPFIIRRPLPNGCSEYWNVRDLEIIS